MELLVVSAHRAVAVVDVGVKATVRQKLGAYGSAHVPVCLPCVRMFPGGQCRMGVKVRARVITVGDVMMWGKRERTTGDEDIQVSILNATCDTKIVG